MGKNNSFWYSGEDGMLAQGPSVTHLNQFWFQLGEVDWGKQLV